MGGIPVGSILGEPFGEISVPLLGFEHRRRETVGSFWTILALLDGGLAALFRRAEQHAIIVLLAVRQRGLGEPVVPERVEYPIDPGPEQFVLVVRSEEFALGTPERPQLLEDLLRFRLAVPRVEGLDTLVEVVARKEVRVRTGVRVRVRRRRRLARSRYSIRVRTPVSKYGIGTLLGGPIPYFETGVRTRIE